MTHTPPPLMLPTPEPTTKCSFWLLSAKFVRRWSKVTLPHFQELRRLYPSHLVRKEITLTDVCTGVLREDSLAVSHRWERPDNPDPEGEQLAAVRSHLQERLAIQWVWMDWWCMPQGDRTPEEQADFKIMLTNVNMVFLGMRVLLLLDMTYMSRFWTQCEAWLAMQKMSRDGLLPRRATRTQQGGYGVSTDANANLLSAGQPRHTVQCIHAAKNAERGLVLALEETWRDRFIGDALTILEKPDVFVTNMSDKTQQLPKVRALNEDLKRLYLDNAKTTSTKLSKAIQQANQSEGDMRRLSHVVDTLASALGETNQWCTEEELGRRWAHLIRNASWRNHIQAGLLKLPAPSGQLTRCIMMRERRTDCCTRFAPKYTVTLPDGSFIVAKLVRPGGVLRRLFAMPAYDIWLLDSDGKESAEPLARVVMRPMARCTEIRVEGQPLECVSRMRILQSHSSGWARRAYPITDWLLGVFEFFSCMCIFHLLAACMYSMLVKEEDISEINEGDVERGCCWRLAEENLRRGGRLKQPSVDLRLAPTHNNAAAENGTTKLVWQKPKWNAEMEVYVLNFEGRAKLASEKNCILGSATDPDTAVLLFGKRDDHEFALDYKAPLSPAQACCIALSIFMVPR